MNRIKVHVGIVFTQAMYCDENGKIYYHKVLTDVDKPWVSVVETVTELKQAIPESSKWLSDPGYLDLQINFTNVQHSPESIRKQLSCPESPAHKLSFRFGDEWQPFLCSAKSLIDQDWLSEEVLTFLSNHIVYKEIKVAGIATMDLKEYFHQELARLYEGEWVCSPLLWEEAERFQPNTS